MVAGEDVGAVGVEGLGPAAGVDEPVVAAAQADQVARALLKCRMANAAAIYARISSDRVGDQAGVRRQVEDCQAEAARRGWTIAEVYVDQDVSAYTGTHRPEYQRLLSNLRDRVHDAVLVYHMDRLSRIPVEIEEFAATCRQVGCELAMIQTDVDISTGDGLLYARIMAAMAAKESDDKSRRVKRKMVEVAQQGRPHGGRYRPFGFEDDKVTIRPEEAAIIRDLADRLLAGESLTSLCNWLIAQDIPTAGGGKWGTTTLRSMLQSARLSGQREHRGQIVGPAVWEPILSPEQTDRIRTLLRDPSRRTNRTARRYLLSGLLRCGRCGTTMNSHPRRGVRRYVCKSGTTFQGCGQNTIPAEPTEQLVTEAVLYRLDSPDLADGLAGRATSQTHTAQLHEAVAADSAQLEELAELYGTKAITAAEWIAARKPIEARLSATRRQLASASQTTAIDSWVGNATQLRERWEGLNLTQHAAIIKTLLDHASVGEVPGNRATFTVERVAPVWRL